jgi:IclR family KDG regulon transcriptional repressor
VYYTPNSYSLNKPDEYSIIGKVPNQNAKLNVSESGSVSDIDGSLVSSVVRAAKILVCLSSGISNVTDLSKGTDLSKSTVHRLLKTLEAPHFVVYNSINHRYYLGPLVTQLASNPIATHQYLVMSALKEMKRLSDFAEETVNLTLLVGIQFIHLYEIESKQGLKVNEQIEDDVAGTAPILPLGAIQKVLLSQLNNRELNLALKSVSIGKKTDYLNDLEPLMTDFNRIRQDGYAITHGERITGALAISTPVKNYFCPVALSVLGPENRLNPKVPQILKELISSSVRLSTDILELFK